MQCRHCPTGQLLPGTTTKTFERGSTLLIVRDIPADVCDTCSAAMFTGPVTERLLELLEDAIQVRAQVLVRTFAFAEDDDATKESTRGRVGAARR